LTAVAGARGGPPLIAPAGDSGFYVRFDEEISEALLGRVLGALAAIESAPPPGLIDVMPGYACVLVIFDPVRVDRERVRAAIVRALAEARVVDEFADRTLEIPVFYHPSVAPDLLDLAAEKGMAVGELVARHTAPEYRCHMLGFRPGFPFLGGLDPRLAAPRLPTPRLSVPAGAVGIGGRQAGVYPGPGPGGWRIIGRTPLQLFDPGRPEPFLVRPGDRVRFVSIDETRFRALASGQGEGGAS
jgi:inhibitor of KinA